MFTRNPAVWGLFALAAVLFVVALATGAIVLYPVIVAVVVVATRVKANDERKGRRAS